MQVKLPRWDKLPECYDMYYYARNHALFHLEFLSAVYLINMQILVFLLNILDMVFQLALVSLLVSLPGKFISKNLDYSQI